MLKPHTEPASRTSGLAATSVGRAEAAPIDVKAAVLEAKARIARKARMRLDHDDTSIASITHTHRQTVVRWRDKDRDDAPSLKHMLSAPDALVDAWLSGLAAERLKLGFAARRWTVTDNERGADRTPQLSAALEKAHQANAELTAIVNAMRGSRGSR